MTSKKFKESDLRLAERIYDKYLAPSTRAGSSLPLTSGVIRTLILLDNTPSHPKDLAAHIQANKICQLAGLTPHATIQANFSVFLRAIPDQNVFVKGKSFIASLRKELTVWKLDERNANIRKALNEFRTERVGRKISAVGSGSTNKQDENKETRSSKRLQTRQQPLENKGTKIPKKNSLSHGQDETKNLSKRGQPSVELGEVQAQVLSTKASIHAVEQNKSMNSKKSRVTNVHDSEPSKKSRAVPKADLDEMQTNELRQSIAAENEDPNEQIPNIPLPFTADRTEEPRSYIWITSVAGHDQIEPRKSPRKSRYSSPIIKKAGKRATKSQKQSIKKGPESTGASIAQDEMTNPTSSVKFGQDSESIPLMTRNMARKNQIPTKIVLNVAESTSPTPQKTTKGTSNSKNSNPKSLKSKSPSLIKKKIQKRVNVGKRKRKSIESNTNYEIVWEPLPMVYIEKNPIIEQHAGKQYHNIQDELNIASQMTPYVRISPQRSESDTAPSEPDDELQNERSVLWRKQPLQNKNQQIMQSNPQQTNNYPHGEIWHSVIPLSSHGSFILPSRGVSEVSAGHAEELSDNTGSCSVTTSGGSMISADLVKSVGGGGYEKPVYEHPYHSVGHVPAHSEVIQAFSYSLPVFSISSFGSGVQCQTSIQRTMVSNEERTNALNN